MMKADLSADTLIQLMREVFTGETLDPERRTRIYARVTSNPSVQGIELWTNPAIPFDAPSVEPPAVEGDQLWLFPAFDVLSSSIGATVSPLLQSSPVLFFHESQATTTISNKRRNLIIEKALLD